MKKVAIQGVKGCFHEQAARLFYEQSEGVVPDICECSTFDGLYSSVEAGDADAAVMAIENTVSDALYRSLRSFASEINGEVLCEWLANLYDSEQGGFYYSASARDYEGFLPDIESTKQAITFFQ